MDRIPAWIKRTLLPAWNGGHRLAWRLGEHLDALARGRYRALHPLRAVRADALSPPGDPPPPGGALGPVAPAGRGPGASRVVRVRLVRRQAPGASAGPRPLADLSRGRPAPAVAIGGRVGAASRGAGAAGGRDQPDRRPARGARHLPQLAASDFTPGAVPGAVVDGVRERGPDAPDLSRRELRPGAHLGDARARPRPRRRPRARSAACSSPGATTSSPCRGCPDVATTFSRATRRDGALVAHATPICHPGGDTGYPVFTEFGADCLDLFRRAGFETTIAFGPATDDDLAQVYSVARWARSTEPGRDRTTRSTSLMLDGPLVFVDVDTQRDFLDPAGALFIPGSGVILPNLARLTGLRPGPGHPRPGHGVRPHDPTTTSCGSSRRTAWSAPPARSGSRDGLARGRGARRRRPPLRRPSRIT